MFFKSANSVLISFLNALIASPLEGRSQESGVLCLALLLDDRCECLDEPLERDLVRRLVAASRGEVTGLGVCRGWGRGWLKPRRSRASWSVAASSSCVPETRGCWSPSVLLPDNSLAWAEDFPPDSHLLQGGEIVQISAFIARVEGRAIKLKKSGRLKNRS